MDKLIDTYNAVVGGIIALLSAVLGQHWILFVIFLIFNVIDWLTGWMKSRMMHKENSAAGLKGILKKLGYWLMIAVAFAAGAVFVEIGNVLDINLKVTTMLGWFVLASLTINELRSICENFIEAGFTVPEIFVKGLQVADEAINNHTAANDTDIDKDDTQKKI